MKSVMGAWNFTWKKKKRCDADEKKNPSPHARSFASFYYYRQQQKQQLEVKTSKIKKRSIPVVFILSPEKKPQKFTG
jgi:hypothetical protein